METGNSRLVVNNWGNFFVPIASNYDLDKLIPRYFPTTVLRLETDLPAGSIALVCQSSACLEPATSIEQV